MRLRSSDEYIQIISPAKNIKYTITIVRTVCNMCRVVKKKVCDLSGLNVWASGMCGECKVSNASQL